MATLASTTGADPQRRVYGESAGEAVLDQGDRGPRGRFAGWEHRFIGLHPATAIASVAFVGYSLVCLVVAGLGALAIHQWSALTGWDDHVVRSWAAHRTPALNSWTSYATKAADTTAIVVVLAAAALILFVLHHRWQALFLVLALSLELLMFLTINSVVGRPRPDGPHLGSVPSTSSFPSGHTAAMIALYGGVALVLSTEFRARIASVVAWIVAIGADAAIGFSRVYRAMHHPSDVVVGALIGFAALFIACTAVRVGQRAAAERARDPAGAA